MRLRSGLFAFVTLVAVVVAALGTTAGAAPSAAGHRLRAFDGCPSFLSYARQHALPLVGPYGIGGGVLGIGVAVPPNAARDAIAGAKAGTEPEFSGTNVQEEGVDEPDLVKTNGRTLFVSSGNGVSAFDVRSSRPRLLGSVSLDNPSTRELLLRGDRLIVLGQGGFGGPIPVDGRAGIRAPYPFPAKAMLTEIDVGDPTRMRVVRTLELDGGYLTARLVGRAIRVVLSSPLAIDLPYVQPVGGSASDLGRSTERNRDVVRSAGARAWLPGFTLRGATGKVAAQGSLVQCRSIRRPTAFSGLGLVTVLTIDAERGLDPLDADAVMSDGRVVYASKSSLYVATDRWDRRLQAGRPIPASSSTTIHRFDIASPTQTHYRSSGVVPGTLFGQWAMSEQDGILRVASTELPVWWGDQATESATTVTTLGERGDALVPLGKVGGLGKGERVYAVRFIGDVGYVVTFRQVDPLYTVDLSIPSRPVVRGELKIRGYSAYLHPLGGDLLLGIGQDATDEGRVVGSQASLFDVSDPRQPKRLSNVVLGKGWSEAEGDHHAFLWWPKNQLAVVPLQAYGDAPFVGAVGLRARRSGVTEVGRVTHPQVVEGGSPGAAIRRSLVVGGTLFTVSDVGVKATSLASFTALGFAKFPS